MSIYIYVPVAVTDCQSPGVDREAGEEEEEAKFEFHLGEQLLPLLWASTGFCSFKMIVCENSFVKWTEQVLITASFISCVSLVATRQDHLATGQ